MPKTLLIDVETSPIIGYTWGTYDVNVLSVIEPVKIICCSWKWLGKDQVHVKALPDYPDYQKGVVNDKKLIGDLWGILDDADIVVAHNGDSFDIKILNTRFIAYDLRAPSDYKSIDTLKVARKYFRFNSNKLDDLGGYLDEGRKAPTGGFETWTKCMAGDAKAWAKMRAYNVKDVELLERIYLRLRPFMQNHPNLNLLDNSPQEKKEGFSCTVCQSFNTQRRGFTVTKVGRYQRHQCNDCGSWSSGPYERVKGA